MKYPDAKAIEAAKKMIKKYKHNLNLLLDNSAEDFLSMFNAENYELFYNNWDDECYFCDNYPSCVFCPNNIAEGMDCNKNDSWYQNNQDKNSVSFILARLCWLHDLVAGRLIFPEVQDD